MTLRELEARIADLESRVVQLQCELRSTHRLAMPGWRRAIEKYADDEDLLAVFAEGRKLRDAERKNARNGKVKARKS